MHKKRKIEKKPQEIVSQVNNSENCPFLEWKYKFNEKLGKNEFDTIKLSDGSPIDEEKLRSTIKQAVGTSDPKIGEKILTNIAFGLAADTHETRINTASAILPALKPRDETEALLLGQFFALQDSGLKCLRNANSQEMFYHIERLFSLATKLLNTANQTMQALLKYRSGGQQIVQVIHVHNEGQAIVAQNLSAFPAGEGSMKEFEN